MVSIVGLLVTAGITTTVGVCEGLSAQKKANNAAKEKAKFNLTATVSLDGERFEECYCILKNGTRRTLLYRIVPYHTRPDLIVVLPFAVIV